VSRRESERGKRNREKREEERRGREKVKGEKGVILCKLKGGVFVHNIFGVLVDSLFQ
jgi:hypothetical protein